MGHNNIKLFGFVDKNKDMKQVAAAAQRIDAEIKNNECEYYYDFDITLNNLSSEFCLFQICMVIALTIERSSDDKRYSKANIIWATSFISKEQINVTNYRNVSLCKTHPTIFNNFTKFVTAKINALNSDPANSGRTLHLFTIEAKDTE